MTNELKHYGVLGMRWGSRRSSDGRSGSSRSTRRAERVKNVKNQRMSVYESNKLTRSRQRKVALAIAGLYIFGKPLYRMAKASAQVAGPVAKQFVVEGVRSGRAAAAARWATRGLNFYKGNPAGSTVVDSTFVNVGKQFLLGAGYG